MTNSSTKTIINIPQPNSTGDMREARLKAVTDPKFKNPLVLSDPIDRQAATLAKIQRIMANPKYKALNETGQARVRGKYYDKYVAPGYANSGLSIPDKNTWVAGVTKHGFQPSDYYHGTSTTQALNLLAGVEDSAGSILKGSLNAGIWVSKQATLGYLGLNKFFTNANNDEYQTQKDSVETRVKQAQKIVNKISGDTIQSAQFWMQTHPSKTLAGNASSFVGENILQLGLYKSIGIAREGIPMAANLTKALSTGGVTGKIVATALGDASDAFMGAVLQGKSKEDTATDMAAFAGFGAFTKGVGIAGSALIKKFSANLLTHGGRPLVEAVISEAEHELMHGKIHGHPAPVNVDITPNHVANALSAAHADDPIKAKLVTAAKISLNSLAMQHYNKPLHNLSQGQRAALRTIHANLVDDAARELPVHVPEIAKANSMAAVQETMQQDPVGAAWDIKMQQKHKINFTETLHESEQESIKQQTGIKSSQGVIKKINKAKNIAIAKKNYPKAVILDHLMKTSMQKMLGPGAD